MQNAAQAYATVAKQIVNPRELEADLLLKAAARLQTILDAWDRKKSELDAALLYNRKLWSIFMISATNTDHALPVDIRQNIANLGLFVMNQTMSMMANPKREQLNPLSGQSGELLVDPPEPRRVGSAQAQAAALAPVGPREGSPAVRTRCAHERQRGPDGPLTS